MGQNRKENQIIPNNVTSDAHLKKKEKAELKKNVNTEMAPVNSRNTEKDELSRCVSSRVKRPT